MFRSCDQMCCLCSERDFRMFRMWSAYVQTVMMQHGLKQNNMVWNETAWKHFSSETFQCKRWKCFNAISWWKKILFDCFFLQWVDLIKDQLDQKTYGLKCLPWHWVQHLKKRFKAFQAFWNACFSIGLSMISCLFQ